MVGGVGVGREGEGVALKCMEVKGDVGVCGD